MSWWHIQLKTQCNKKSGGGGVGQIWKRGGVETLSNYGGIINMNGG